VPVATSWPKAAEAGSLGDLETRQCFHVLGFDVMLTADGKPHLLEVSCDVSSPTPCCLPRGKTAVRSCATALHTSGSVVQCSTQTAQAFGCAPLLRMMLLGARPQLRRVDCTSAITAPRR
jgi:hypothetical protein